MVALHEQSNWEVRSTAAVFCRWIATAALCIYTVKTLGLLQPYFGHLSCMPVVHVTCYTLQTSKDASNLIQSVVEKLLYFVID